MSAILLVIYNIYRRYICLQYCWYYINLNSGRILELSRLSELNFRPKMPKMRAFRPKCAHFDRTARISTALRAFRSNFDQNARIRAPFDRNLTQMVLLLIQCCRNFLTSSSNGHHAGPGPNYARNGACGLSSSGPEHHFDRSSV